MCNGVWFSCGVVRVNSGIVGVCIGGVVCHDRKEFFFIKRERKKNLVLYR